MRTLQHIEEFKREASNALFTKQQAISITLRLLELEANDPEGNEEDRATLLEAMEKTEFRYLDSTKTNTDQLLDSFGVARITAEDIVAAIDYILFDVK